MAEKTDGERKRITHDGSDGRGNRKIGRTNQANSRPLAEIGRRQHSKDPATVAHPYSYHRAACLIWRDALIACCVLRFAHRLDISHCASLHLANPCPSHVMQHASGVKSPRGPSLSRWSC